MKSKIISITVFTLLLVSYGWRNTAGPSLEKLEWMIGTWENKTRRGNVYETWTRNHSKAFAGKSYMINGADTMVFENIQLLEEAETLFYIPTVKNQNGGLPVRFRLKELSDSSVLFENPEHDFPQAIAYTKKGRDSLLAEISGWRADKLVRVNFPMKKIR